MARTRHRLRGALLLALGLCAAGGAHARSDEPEWVQRHGLSEAFPKAVYVTGYGVGSGDDALAHAKQQAAADLARQLSVRIESEVNDVSRERDGEYSYKVASVIRATTDVQLSDLRYEPPYQHRGRVHVLAWVRRAEAARARLAHRDRARAEAKGCLAAGLRARKAGRKQSALETFEGCRAPVAEALHQQAVARALLPAAHDAAAFDELVGLSHRLDEEIDGILNDPSPSLASAADAMALQLARQGVSKRSRLVVSHFNYGVTNLSSSFGRQAGVELERALARLREEGAGGSDDPAPPDLGIAGVYLESGDELRISATAREIQSGRLVASAEARMPVSAVPERLEVKPRNFESALRDQRILSSAPGEGAGGLRLEVWTDKGRGGVLYTEQERLHLFMRVNQPAWVRLVYVLQSGDQVPIDQAFRIGGVRVNQVVEYPQSFEVVPPFGVEMIHATAFTERPERLATRERIIDGIRYDVLSEGIESVVRTRGIAIQQNRPIAEDTVTVTTTPRL